MKCSILLHFIWVFTVCNTSSRLGVSSIQRVNVINFRTFLKEMLFIRTEIHKMHVRTANREDPDKGLHCAHNEIYIKAALK